MPSHEPAPSSFRATPRVHAADDVFEQLAAAILRGELAPGASLPPERSLAEQFRTSRIIARQAIHRLAELGLVRVRQGGATTVLDPDEAGDLRVLELLYRLAPGEGARSIDPRQVLEKQLLQGVALVEVAARCGSQADLVRIHEMTETFAASDVDEDGYRAFEERFWRTVATAGGSRIFMMEVTWWYRILARHPRVESHAPSPLSQRVAFYREVARRLDEGDAPVAFYLEAVGVILKKLRRAGRKKTATRPESRAKRKRTPRALRVVASSLAAIALLAGTGCRAASVGTAMDSQDDGGGDLEAGTADASRAADGGSSLPCAVDTVLGAHCRQCHGQTPSFGAPMPLVTHADLWAPAHSNPEQRVYQLVEQRIHDDAHPMPQPPNPRLGTADLATIDAWVSAGAPPGEACDGSAPAPDGGSLTSLPCTPDTHVAPASPWSMPASVSETYVCYGVDVNVASKRQIIAMAPHIDNAAILHHVTLLESDTAVSPVPATCPLSGSTSWRPVFGWAPGGSSFVLPPEAGFAEDATTHFVVQLHYVNPLGEAGATDSSGFDLCTTDQLRPNDADVMAFGTENISIPPNATVTETCDVQVPTYGDTTHLFAAFPHMHELGRSIETTAFPAGGGSVDLGGQPDWNFGEQGWIPISDVLAPGDVVETRCTWVNTTDETVGFGETSANEMCFSFTMYYPKITDPSWNWALPALYAVCH